MVAVLARFAGRLALLAGVLVIALALAAYAVGSGKRGPLTAKLQALYFDTVNGRNAAKAAWLTPVA
mgnify:CR=1 FL=1